MQDIKVREEKIQAKRMQTPWREFLKLASRYPFVLYKKNDLLSRYNPNNGRGENIVSIEAYYRDIDNFSKDYHIEYSGDFFDDLRKLIKIAPLCSMKNVGENPNTSYADIIFSSKNIYLSSVVLSCENVLYSFQIKSSNNIYNSIMIWKGCDNIYFSRSIIESYNIFYSSYIKNSNNIWFCSNLVGCHDCIDCHETQNQSYCIKNQQYTPEEYQEKKTLLLKEKQTYLEKYTELIKKQGNNVSCNLVTGQGNMMCENIENAYWCSEVKNGKNVFLVGGHGTSENMYDVFSGGMECNNNFYGVMGAGYHTENIYCSAEIAINSSYCYYSFNLEACTYCLGCVGLKNKSFCILNKQYTKEERYELANKIFAQMDVDGTLGSFFPGWMNPFYFNDTAAYLIDDTFTKEEVTAEGYLRRDEEIKVDIPEGADIVVTSDECRVTGGEKLLSDYQGFDDKGNREINPEILKKVIKDEKGNYYRIVPMELDFLQKHGLPLPELHWLDRIKLGFKFK